ncbi:tetraacyldisaccharide 4'-kinase [Limibacter armeniacum]|uniref:tetraacyldisaccharide 4'-kinase n=1 Tax=Limibacter armeniacum TaxID=466084 RepID=UPI002FE578E1
MNFLKGLLMPFAAIYDGVTAFRNTSFDKGWKKSVHFDVPVISVGNLTVGGTGKTPHIEYLIRLLKDQYRTGVLSRGYGRKTTGYILADEQATARSIGDEPMQFYAKFGTDVMVAVGEERALAIPQMLHEDESIKAILLDDAYQHRKVKRDLDILLTDYGRLFYQDFVLPAGRLRESRKGALRADIVIVSKCPDNLAAKERAVISQNIKRYTRADVPVLFTGIRYGKLQKLNESAPEVNSKNIVLVTGIAHSMRLKEDLRGRGYNIIEHLEFGDHYSYNRYSIKRIQDAYTQFSNRNAFILTTEKDAVKLMQDVHKESLKDIPVYYQPIEVYFLEGEEILSKKVMETVAAAEVEK